MKKSLIVMGFLDHARILLWSVGGAGVGGDRWRWGQSPKERRFSFWMGKAKRVLEGKTPLVGKIAAGVYHLVIQRAGFYEEARSLRVEAGKPVFWTLS